MAENIILNQGKHYYSMSEMLSSGLTYYKINRMVSEGILVKLNNKMYENAKYAGEESDYVSALVYAPKGVVCMLSAARYYGLTTYLPDGIDIAIERNMKISTLPDWPRINLWYFPEKRYSVGQSVQTDNGLRFCAYDIEKTVADVLYYRNKVGIEEVKEILKKYLARADRDLIKLHCYADALGCGKILRTYMEVLL